MIEHVYKDSLKNCLYSKRIAKQEVNPERVVFKCKKVKAETEVYQDRKRIIRRDFTAIEVMKLTEKKKKIRTDKSKSQDLKDELNKQTNFLNGEIE